VFAGARFQAGFQRQRHQDEEPPQPGFEDPDAGPGPGAGCPRDAVGNELEMVPREHTAMQEQALKAQRFERCERR